MTKISLNERVVLTLIEILTSGSGEPCNIDKPLAPLLNLKFHQYRNE